MQIGSLTAFLAYLMQILMSVMMATFMAIIIPRAAVCAERISEVLDTESSVARRSHPGAEVALPGEVELAATSGSPTPAPAGRWSRASPSPPSPGQTTAIIGSTGAGKTTLISLIPRLVRRDRRAASGSTASTCATWTPRLLWRRIGLVPQKAFLFTGTVASNLRYGEPDATDEELWEALEMAQADDFVAALPEGLDAPMTQGGTNFSGGQRQRLADRPGRRAPSPRCTCSTTRSRRSTWPPTRGCAQPCGRHPGVGRWSSSPSECRASSTPTRSWSSTTAPLMGPGRHEELLGVLRHLRGEIVVSQLPRGGGGMSQQTAPRPAPGGFRGPAGGAIDERGGMPAEKSLDFWPSAKRLLPPAAARTGPRRCWCWP